MPETRPKVSVILPVKNAEPYIGDAIRSILGQTYNNLEVIVIDDGSTDGTHHILSSFKDSRIKIITHQTSFGIAKSLNEGIAASSGDFIARMDGDDISVKQRIETQVMFLKHHPEIGICGSYAATFGDKKLIIRHPTSPTVLAANLLFRTSLVHPTVMMRRKQLIEKQLFYDETYTNAQDYDLWTRASEAGISMGNIPKKLLLYRVLANSARNNRAQQQALFSKMILARQFKRLGITPTNEEWNIHMHIRNYSFPEGADAKAFIESVEQWFEKIWNANEEKKIYTLPALGIVLANEWLNALLSIRNSRKSLPWKTILLCANFRRALARRPQRTLGVLLKSTAL